MEQDQLKEIAELLDPVDLIICLINFNRQTKQYLLQTTFNKKHDTFNTYNQAFSVADELKIDALIVIEPFDSILSDTSFSFIHSLTTFYKDTYLVTVVNHPEPGQQQLLKNTIQLTIENYLLNKKLEAQEKKYQAYLQEVKTIKEKLLPSAEHTIEGLDYATYYKPNIGGGGDYFDIMDLRDARRRAGYEDTPLVWGVGLVDVSGHGPGAAVEVAMVDAILRTFQGQIGTVASDVMAYLNQHFFTRQSRGGYCTAFLCNYDAEADLFSYSSAGHLPVLIKHHEGHVTVLESETGIPIGIDRDATWVTETTQLEQGDTIILYTDGITEAESVSGEQFGFERLKQVLEDSPAGSAELLMSHFMHDYHQHIDNSTKQDDQTLIMVTISS